MRLQFSKRDRAQHDSRPVARTMTPLGHNRVDDMRQGLKRELKKRDDHEKDCESSDDEEDDDDEKDSTKTPSPSAKPTKSKCSSPSPPPTGLSMQPPSTQLGGLTTTFAGRLQPTVLPLSVSAFPVMSTGASLIATATTLSLNAPAFTPLLPSGTRKSDSGLQAVQASSHPSLSPHAKTALIAFGAIMGIALFGFAIFTALRCMKRKRSEASAYGDMETIYRSDHASTSMSVSATIAPPPNAYVARPVPSQKFYLPPIFRTSQRPWSGSSFRRSRSSKATEDPFADQAYTDPGKGLFPPLAKAVTRKEVGGRGEDPFRDPEMDEIESVAASTVRKFHTTPSWVDDQAVRAGTTR